MLDKASCAQRPTSSVTSPGALQRPSSESPAEDARPDRKPARGPRAAAVGSTRTGRTGDVAEGSATAVEVEAVPVERCRERFSASPRSDESAEKRPASTGVDPSPSAAPRFSSRASRGRAVLVAALHDWPLSEQTRGLRFPPVPRPRIAWASSTARCSTRVTPGILRRRAEFKASSTSQRSFAELRPPLCSHLCSVKMPKQGALAPRRMSSAATSLWLPMHASHVRQCCADSTICQP